MTDKQAFRFFSCVEGYACPRFGALGSFIGAFRVPGGYDWQPDTIVAIPIAEFNRHLKAYNRAIKGGRIKVRTEKDYKESIKALEDKAREEQEARRQSKDKPSKSKKKKSEGDN